MLGWSVKFDTLDSIIDTAWRWHNGIPSRPIVA